MLIAVPGWPLPTFWTASMASTRAVSIARRSSSPKPSGRVGCGWAGLPVGASVAASAGASDSVLCVPCGGCSLGVGPASCGRASGPVRRWTGRPSSSTSALPAAHAASTRSTLVIRAHAAPWPAPVARATVAARSRPRFERGLVLSRCRDARARALVPTLSETAAPARRLPAVARGPGVRRLRRAHQAADHRAAAGDDGAGDDAGRPRVALVAAAAVHAASAARSRPARPTSSTATTTATSTG